MLPVREESCSVESSEHFNLLCLRFNRTILLSTYSSAMEIKIVGNERLEERLFNNGTGNQMIVYGGFKFLENSIHFRDVKILTAFWTLNSTHFRDVKI